MPIPWAKRKDRVRLWEQNNKENGRMPYWNDRARWLNARVKKHYRHSETVSGDELQNLYVIAGKKCFYCGRLLKPSEVHFDHMNPLTGGGRNEISNLCIACQDCNLLKGPNSTDEFLYDVYNNKLPESVYGHLFAKG
jgi:5-methylcytosine-specific restriction endonuclease McrA